MSKVFIEETTLSAIGDAIREKTGKSDMIAPGVMPDEIRGIETGGGGSIEVEPIVLTGSQENGFASQVSKRYLELFSNTITTKDLTAANGMFTDANNIEEIPFDINMSKSATSTHIANIFRSCSKLKTVPYIYNAKHKGISQMFSGCWNLREIPQDYCDTWDFTYVESQTSGYSCSGSGVFQYCYSLRKFPMEILAHANPKVVDSYSNYAYAFSSCYALDEVIDLPVLYDNITGSYFNGTFDQCARLKNVTFATNEDGSPKVATWRGQVITINPSTSGSYITGYNSGITVDKWVKDDATYQALKNDPDWYTTELAYSRYDHDSAVRTINSLPDTSAYLATNPGVNTIRFNGNAGSKTDGGAINTLTEEEIAVATAKGWTVAFI